MSRLQTMPYEGVLITETCCDCGVTFAMPQGLQMSLQRTGDFFYCPSGHKQHYSQSVEQQLIQVKAALESAQKSEAWWKEQAEEKGKQLTSTRGQLTRLKGRIAKGVCPCCHRQFVQLQQHMKTKHPDYSQERD